MSIIIKGAAYMALVYEACGAFLTMVQMVNFFKIMKFDMMDVMILTSAMCRVLCFGGLVVGVVTRHRLMIKIWLLMAYLQIQWGAIGDVCFNIFQYFFTDKFRNRQEFLHNLSAVYGPIVGQVLARIGIILIIYRLFKSMDEPKPKSKTILDQVTAELKAK